jgi:hypothetical protein
MENVPDFVTHYYLADKRPFLNLCDVAETDLGWIMKDLERRRATSGLKRVFGPRYMHLRRLTETRLHELFLEAGATPERQAPHYFVLGSSQWYRGLAPDTREVVLPLGNLPLEITSFTYPDSFTAMAFGPRFGLPLLRRPYHERVFRLPELEDVVAQYGLPADGPEGDYDGYAHRPFEKYIEIQLWSDDPIRSFLSPASERPTLTEPEG